MLMLGIMMCPTRATFTPLPERLPFAPDAVLRFGDGDFGQFQHADGARRNGVHEVYVHFIDVIFETLEPAARHFVLVDRVVGAGRVFQLGITRKLRRLAFAEIAVHETQILAHRIRVDLHLGGKRCVLGRLFDALTGWIEHPAVVETADAIVFDPAERQRRLPVRTAIVEQDDGAALPAIKREVLVRKLRPHRPAFDEIGAARDRMPEPAQVAPG